MKTKRYTVFILSFVIALSLSIKLLLVFKYGNQLTLSSDDLNYVKSAAVLIEKNIFIYYKINEPTVFVTPLYPFFLAAVFRLFGYGPTGMQTVRIIQVVFSCITVIMTYLIAYRLFSTGAALVSAFITAFYPPNVTTAGYLLTETMFTMLFCILIYLSLVYAVSPGSLKFAALGVILAAAVLCRPAIALYPALFLIYLLAYYRTGAARLVKPFLAMLLAFAAVMSPWWIRNYAEYGMFIPLTASGGNPMLQGTYINYKYVNDTSIKLPPAKNSVEANRNETLMALTRIKNGFRKDFWNYLRWYTIGKTLFLWGTVFYWKEFLGMKLPFIIFYHYIILTGFIYIPMLLHGCFLKYLLPVLAILYYNIVHCIYMAFDRYAFPVLPLLTAFCAYGLLLLYNTARRLISAG